MQRVAGSILGRVRTEDIFLHLLHLVAQYRSVLGRFRHGSEQRFGDESNKQGEIVTGRPCGSVAQWSECSHGMREVLGSSPGRAVCFFLPCDILAPYVALGINCRRTNRVVRK